MGSYAYVPAERTAGGKLLAAHRYFKGKGPATEEQIILLLIQNFNCTPSEAINELKDNPYIWDIISAFKYQQAFSQVEEWYKLDSKGREGKEPPEGYWAELAERHRADILREGFEERETELVKQGRI